MVKELGRLYGAMVEDRGVEGAGLEEVAIQYGDYAEWQREWMEGEVLEEELKYWREKLGGVGVLELPVDHPRPAVMSQRGGRVRVELGRELTLGLKELSRGEGVTLF